jgi:hypothetical protein
METNVTNPARWSEVLWGQIMDILAAYIMKWSGPLSLFPLSPADRDEIRSRIILDIMTGDPEGRTPLHHAMRTARQWRVRGWAGDCETDRDRKRRETAAARREARDPGSREAEEGRNKSPYRGTSDDSRQPRPDRILEAIETAMTAGLQYVSDRQAKARRRAVKGKKPVQRFRAVPVGRVGRPPRRNWNATGRLLYWPGSATRIAWVPLPITDETGEDGRPHRPHRGTVANRMIGKSCTDPLGTDPIGEAMAKMVLLGRD